jgi:hypothetical protein
VPKPKAVPKVLHFVWVGNDIPTEHIDNIAAWKHAHPKYRVILWYDGANMLANTIRKKAAKAQAGRQPYAAMATSPILGTNDPGRATVLAGKAATAGNPTKDRDYYMVKAGAKLFTLQSKLRNRQLEGCDIRAYHAQSFSNMHVYDVEMANETPNFGAASDVLRLEILIEHGGIYLDVDLGFFKPLPDPVLVREELALFGIYASRACNALIAAHAGSDMLKRCRASIANSYSQLNVDQALLREYDTSMRDFTIRRTGPTVVRNEANAAENEVRVRERLGYAEAMDWAMENVYFPDGYIDWDTPASKVHKWY